MAREIKKGKENFYETKVKPNAQNAKLWWKSIKSLCNLTNSTGLTLINKDTNEPLTKSQMAKEINTFFPDLTSNYPPVMQEWFSCGNNTPLPLVSVDSVISRPKIIKHSKEAADLIGPILCDIINHSFCSKELTANWKIYDICPIPKIIPPPSVKDLRPIALTSIFSKIQESFSVEWMTQDVLPNVTPSQYGGLAGSSTTLALLNLLHNWYQALDQPHAIIRVLFLDFTKAFDLINHNKLLHDMQRMGVREAPKGKKANGQSWKR